MAKKTEEQRQAKKDTEFHILRHTQYLRAAYILVEKVLRYDPTLTWSIEDVAANGMIRRRYIKEALLTHPQIVAVPNKKRSMAEFKWNGPELTHHFKGRAPVRKLKSR